ncbi:hypothetical protein EVAR_36316_1 [Eumeta japonica]|uniref:Uncharacterized protein n=1 Tax=Eumeta variegata TaxID=151549 RepID=A0A4C1VKG9_EUMVA|nr:hypothetical protein EVAR_36316_1 [Eumeta japonica]
MCERRDIVGDTEAKINTRITELNSVSSEAGLASWKRRGYVTEGYRNPIISMIRHDLDQFFSFGAQLSYENQQVSMKMLEACAKCRQCCTPTATYEARAVIKKSDRNAVYHFADTPQEIRSPRRLYKKFEMRAYAAVAEITVTVRFITERPSLDMGLTVSLLRPWRSWTIGDRQQPTTLAGLGASSAHAKLLRSRL